MGLENAQSPFFLETGRALGVANPGRDACEEMDVFSDVSPVDTFAGGIRAFWICLCCRREVRVLLTLDLGTIILWRQVARRFLEGETEIRVRLTLIWIGTSLILTFGVGLLECRFACRFVCLLGRRFTCRFVQRVVCQFLWQIFFLSGRKDNFAFCEASILLSGPTYFALVDGVGEKCSFVSPGYRLRGWLLSLFFVSVRLFL